MIHALLEISLRTISSTSEFSPHNQKLLGHPRSATITEWSRVKIDDRWRRGAGVSFSSFVMVFITLD